MARHSRTTIISMAVIASCGATLLHEGVGHGGVAWLRGAGPTELTSNHLSTLKADRWVEAGGTLVNLVAGVISLSLARHEKTRANRRYFLWLFSAFNLLAGTGYFMYSGIAGIGDWSAVISGLPHQILLRVAMSVVGFALYYLAVLALAKTVAPFVPDRRTYNAIGRLPYVAACVFACMAGMLDPLGWKLLLISSAAAAFGGYSGLLWADSLLPGLQQGETLTIQPSRLWWASALIIGLAYIGILGPGVRLG